MPVYVYNGQYQSYKTLTRLIQVYRLTRQTADVDKNAKIKAHERVVWTLTARLRHL